MPAGCPEPGATLLSLARAHGKQLGTAYRPQYAADDRCYGPEAGGHFDSLTPEIATFFNAIQPTEGRFDFSDADAVCAFARQHRQQCQVHDVVWDPIDHPEWGIVPQWVSAQTPERRRAIMIDHVTQVAGHFAGRVDSDTVVNEAFDDRGQLKVTTWNTTGDDSYIFDAFRAARRADPNAKLFYNDFGAEDLNPKSNAILALAQRLRAEKVTVTTGGHTRYLPLIDGVGLQMHVGLGAGQSPSPAAVVENIRRLGAAGLTVRITEMDVRIPVAVGVASDQDLARQQASYRDLARTCVDAPNCESITFWGFTDAHSWITDNPLTFSGQGAAHPLDRAYHPKPAYEGLRQAFR